MTNEQELAHLSRLIEQAAKAAEHNSEAFKRILAILELSELNETDAASLFVLALQYRLDGEDVIKSLIQADKNLCAALGITHENTKARNLDLIHYYLGKSKTAHDFSILLDLDGELIKALSLNQRLAKLLAKEKKHLERLARLLKISLKDEEPREEPSKKMKKAAYVHYGADAIAEQLKDAQGFQNLFQFSLQELTEAMQEFGQVPKFGIQYDYLAGLKGPISRFNMAYLHGIGTCESVLQHLENSLPKQEQKKTSVLHQALKQVLNDKNKSLQAQVHEANQRLYKAEALQHQLQNTQADEKRFEEAQVKRRTMRWF